MTAVQARARFHDGRAAALHEVAVTLDDNALTVVSEQVEVLATWPVADIRLVGEPEPDGTVRLCRVQDMARLTISNPEFAARIRATCPNLKRDAYSRSSSWRPVLLWSLGALASLVLFLFVLVPIASNQLASVFPAAWEDRMGVWMADSFIPVLIASTGGNKDRPVCEAPEGVAALRRLTAPLTAHVSGRAHLSFRVINSSMVNAVALPGGQILVLHGLINTALSPNEIAGVIAHELGHVELRHPLQISISRSTGAFVIGLIFGEPFGLSAAALGLSTLVSGYYSRDMETDADRRGLELMRAADFSAAPLAGFFDRLALREKNLKHYFSFASTHPDSSARAERAREAGNAGRGALSAADWHALRTICR